MNEFLQLLRTTFWLASVGPPSQKKGKNMLFVIFVLLLALICLTIIFAEAKHLALVYIFTFMLFLLTGAVIAEEGITIDYGTIIETGQGDQNHLTTVDYNTESALILTTENEKTINYLANFFIYGSFMFIAIFLVRNDSFAKQSIYNKYS